MLAKNKVLRIVQDESLLRIMDSCRGRMFGHVKGHDSFIRKIIERNIGGKRGKGTRSYLDRIKD